MSYSETKPDMMHGGPLMVSRLSSACRAPLEYFNSSGQTQGNILLAA